MQRCSLYHPCCTVGLQCAKGLLPRQRSQAIQVSDYRRQPGVNRSHRSVTSVIYLRKTFSGVSLFVWFKFTSHISPIANVRQHVIIQQLVINWCRKSIICKVLKAYREIRETKRAERLRSWKKKIIILYFFFWLSRKIRVSSQHPAT